MHLSIDCLEANFHWPVHTLGLITVQECTSQGRPNPVPDQSSGQDLHNQYWHKTPKGNRQNRSTAKCGLKKSTMLYTSVCCSSPSPLLTAPHTAPCMFVELAALCLLDSLFEDGVVHRNQSFFLTNLSCIFIGPTKLLKQLLCNTWTSRNTTTEQNLTPTTFELNSQIFYAINQAPSTPVLITLWLM